MNREEFINALNEKIQNDPDHNEIVSYYYELINDTNIDLGMLYTYFALCDRFEMVTEWCGNHSLHLLERDKGNYFDYEYENEYGGNSSSSDRGNILSVNVYLFDRLRVKYNIFYKV